MYTFTEKDIKKIIEEYVPNLQNVQVGDMLVSCWTYHVYFYDNNLGSVCDIDLSSEGNYVIYNRGNKIICGPAMISYEKITSTVNNAIKISRL